MTRAMLSRVLLAVTGLYVIYVAAAVLAPAGSALAWSGHYREPRPADPERRVELDLSPDGSFTLRARCLTGCILSDGRQTGLIELKGGRLRLIGADPSFRPDCGVAAEFYPLRWSGHAYLASAGDLQRLVNDINFHGFAPWQMQGLLRRRDGIVLPDRSTPPDLPRPFRDRLLPRPLHGRILATVGTGYEPLWGWMRAGLRGYRFNHDVEVDIGSAQGAYPGLMIEADRPPGARLTLTEVGATRSRARFTLDKPATPDLAPPWDPSMEDAPAPRLPAAGELPQAGARVSSRAAR